VKSGDYEQPVQDDGYGRIRDSAEEPDSSYGDLTDVSVKQRESSTNEYLKPGDSLGHDYQNSACLEQHENEDDNHEYHEVEEDKKILEGEDDHEYHEVEDQKEDGYEHPPDFDHEYHEVSDLANNTGTLNAKNTPSIEFDSSEYNIIRNQSRDPLINSNQNNNSNNNNNSEYVQVTDDMLLPPHKRVNSLQSNHENP